MKFVSQISKELLFCSELQVRDYKKLLKCSYGETPNKLIFVETVCEILTKITNKPIEYIKSLNIIDVFCLLLDIRATSAGPCKIVLSENDQKLTVELNLNLVKKDTLEMLQGLSTTIKHNEIEIVFECPCMERLLQTTNDDYVSYIKGSYITKNGTKKFIQINTNEQAELLFNKIPPKISLEIISKFNAFVEKITGMNFLSRYGIKNQQLIFVPSLDSLIWFTKLMFNEDLHSFYENIFHLSYTGKMNSEYVESLAVGEYNYFLGLLRQVIAAQNSSNTSSENNSGLSDDGM